jgi:hypothetical protein
MKTITKSGLKVNAGVKAGGLGGPNHNSRSLKVRSGLKAGDLINSQNHNTRLLAVA